MTLVIALVCEDGIVMASDGQATFPGLGGGTKGPMENKICSIHNLFLMGSSGETGFIERVQHGLMKAQSNYFVKPPMDLRRNLVKTINPLQHEAKAQLVSFPSVLNPEIPPHGGFLFAGVRDGAPWIIEIDPHGRDGFQDQFGFAAIGSGDQFARAILQQYVSAARPTVEEGKIFSWAAVSDAIEIAAYGLGHPISLWEIKKDDPPRKLPKGEVDSIRDATRVWRELQRESLRDLTQESSDEEAVAEAPDEKQVLKIPKSD